MSHSPFLMAVYTVTYIVPCSGIFLVPSDLSLCPAVIPNESFSAKGN
jgi:hypothetical protein